MLTSSLVMSFDGNFFFGKTSFSVCAILFDNEIFLCRMLAMKEHLCPGWLHPQATSRCLTMIARKQFRTRVQIEIFWKMSLGTSLSCSVNKIRPLISIN